MDWRDVLLLYRRELRSALRERSIVINGILMPIFLYPAMLWAMFSAFTFVEGLAEGFTSRVVVFETPPAHEELVDSLEAREGVDLREAPASLEEARARVAEGDLDAVVVFRAPEAEARALDDNVRIELFFDRSVERSRRARTRIEETVDAYRSRWMNRQAQRYGIAPEAREQFRVVRENVATDRQMGQLVLSQLIPLFMVLMVALGCFVPSVDTTAGERERSTWETTISMSPSRTSIVTAKYLYVATLGIVAGALNVVAIFVSIGAVIAPLAGESNLQFSIPLEAIPVLLAGAVALALFFAAAMMILAAFARTFKDGQAMVTPVYWLALVPLVLGDQADQTLTPAIAAVPVANIAMMMRDAINGVFLWPLIGQTLLVSAVLVVACLWLARTILSFESFMMGAYDGSFWRFAKERLLPGRSPTRDRP